MVKPVSPAQPLNGEGSEKYEPKQKGGPSEFDKTLEKEKAERARAEISKMLEETRAKEEAERPRTYAERLKDMGYYDKTSKEVLLKAVVALVMFQAQTIHLTQTAH